jgi:hypothetical protein
VTEEDKTGNSQREENNVLLRSIKWLVTIFGAALATLILGAVAAGAWALIIDHIILANVKIDVQTTKTDVQALTIAVTLRNQKDAADTAGLEGELAMIRNSQRGLGQRIVELEKTRAK